MFFSLHKNINYLVKSWNWRVEKDSCSRGWLLWEQGTAAAGWRSVDPCLKPRRWKLHETRTPAGVSMWLMYHGSCRASSSPTLCCLLIHFSHNTDAFFPAGLWWFGYKSTWYHGEGTRCFQDVLEREIYKIGDGNLIGLPHVINLNMCRSGPGPRWRFQMGLGDFGPRKKWANGGLWAHIVCVTPGIHQFNLNNKEDCEVYSVWTDGKSDNVALCQSIFFRDC